MITNFRLYESNKNEPQEGDYVICDDCILKQLVGRKDKNAYEYLLNTVGQITVKVGYSSNSSYVVRYESIPHDLEHRFEIHEFGDYGTRSFDIDEILFYGKTKESVLAQQKGNMFDL